MCCPGTDHFRERLYSGQIYLTTVQPFPEVIGSRAAHDLIDSIEDPASVRYKPVYIEPVLVEGCSVKDLSLDKTALLN